MTRIGAVNVLVPMVGIRTVLHQMTERVIRPAWTLRLHPPELAFQIVDIGALGIVPDDVGRVENDMVAAQGVGWRKVLHTQTRCDEVVLRLSPYSHTFVEVLTERPSLPRAACRPGPTPPSTSMRLHGSTRLPASSSKFSRIRPDAPREIRLVLDPYPGAGCSSARGIAVTQTSSPARAAARHVSLGRLA